MKILKRLLGGLLLLVAAIALLVWSQMPPGPPDYQVFFNGNIITMDEGGTVVSAVAVREDRIIATGTREQVLEHIASVALVEPDQIVYHDLQGRTMLPGFVDAHSHFPGWGGEDMVVDLNSPPIGGVRSIEQAIDKLSAMARQTDPGEWVIGVGFDDTLVEEHRHINRDDLDRVSTEHPVFVFHISGHIASGNSLALDAAGIDDTTQAPEGGVIQRDGAGRVNGVLEETARLGMAELAFDFSLLDFLSMVQGGSASYAAMGVTTAQSGLAPEKLTQGLKLMSTLGIVPQRLVILPDHEYGEKWLAGEIDPAEQRSERFRVGAVKLVADGSIQGYTGYLLEPYHVPYKGDETYRGYPVMEQDALNETVARYHRENIQLAIHANGDAAVEAAVQAIEAANRAHPWPDNRHVIIHAQMATDDQLSRMKAEGATPSFFSAHTYYWGDRHADIFMGPVRAANMSPAGSAQRMGLRFSTHLDTPVVPMDPLFAVWTVVNRVSSSGRELGPNQRVDMQQALRAVTIDAAWQAFLEEDIGSIEAGKFADFAVIDGDPFENPRVIDGLRVLETWIGGVQVYSVN